MPRGSEVKATIEAERLAILHREQQALRKRIIRETKIKKASPHLPGEEMLKKNTAVLLKIGVPGISFSEIAARLGETKGTVRGWFRDDPDIKEFYEWAVANLRDGALSLMKTYSLEAVETLVLLMRFGSEKYMFESAREILDRVGVPKVERREIESEEIQSHKWADRDELVSEIRELPIELQEQAVEALERFEELLAKNPASVNGSEPEDSSEDSSELETISRDDSEEDDDDEAI